MGPTDIDAAVEGFLVADAELVAMGKTGDLMELQDYRSLLARHRQARKTLTENVFGGVKQEIEVIRGYCTGNSVVYRPPTVVTSPDAVLAARKFMASVNEAFQRMYEEVEK